jgi:hypothetical protein
MYMQGMEKRKESELPEMCKTGVLKQVFPAQFDT